MDSNAGVIVAVSQDESGRRFLTVHSGKYGGVKVWEHREPPSWAALNVWEEDGALASRY